MMLEEGGIADHSFSLSPQPVVPQLFSQGYLCHRNVERDVRGVWATGVSENRPGGIQREF